MCSRLMLNSACAVLLLAVTGCGGGSDSTPTPTPPSPVAVNSPPVARITIDNMSVDEGQPFTLDGTSSSDPDGDDLFFEWNQLSGPSPIPGGSFSIITSLPQTAPEVAESAIATFELTVSDEEFSDTTTIDVTFANISQSPKADFELMETSTIATRDGVRFVRNFGDEARDFADGRTSGDLGFFRVENSGQSIPVENTVIGSQVGVAPNSIFHDSFSSLILQDFPFVAVEESNGLIQFVRVDTEEGTGELEDFESAGQFSIEAPCAIATSSSFPDQVLIGQRTGGLSLMGLEYRFINEFGQADVVTGANVVQEIEGEENFCGFGTNFSGNVLAVDTLGMSVSLFNIVTDPAENETRLSLDRTVSLDLPAGAENLEVVDTLDVGQGVLILVTDGQHDGSHHLIYVLLEDENIFEGGDAQQRYSWTKGIPTDIALTDLFSDGRLGVVIASSSSPEAIVFARPTGSFSNLVGPQFLEIGLGAQELIGVQPLRQDDHGLLVTFPEQNEIRFLSPR